MNQYSILYNCWPIPSQIISTFYYATFGVALYIFWNQNCKTTKICLNGIGKRVLVNFWDFQIIIILSWKMLVIWAQAIFHLSLI